jgi:hypothetical protein
MWDEAEIDWMKPKFQQIRSEAASCLFEAWPFSFKAVEARLK